MSKQLLAHVVGDYILQTDYEAQEKTKRWLPAAMHATKYTAAFLPLTRNKKALVTIGATHLILDRYRLAKQLCWAKNQLAPKAYRYPWSEGKLNGGYSQNTPPYMSTWLMIIADNAVHMMINHYALEKFNES